MNRRIVLLMMAVLIAVAEIAVAQTGYQPRQTDASGAAQVPGATTMWVRRDAADVYKTPQRGADMIAELKKNAPVAVLATEGLRYKIQMADGRQGYIAKLYLTDIKPVQDDKGFRVFARDDIGAGEQANVESVRGLRKESDEAAIAEGMQEIVVDQLTQMENLSLTISEEEVDLFLEEGGVKPL